MAKVGDLSIKLTVACEACPAGGVCVMSMAHGGCVTCGRNMAPVEPLIRPIGWNRVNAHSPWWRCATCLAESTLEIALSVEAKHGAGRCNAHGHMFPSKEFSDAELLALAAEAKRKALRAQHDLAERGMGIARSSTLYRVPPPDHSRWVAEEDLLCEEAS